MSNVWNEGFLRINFEIDDKNTSPGVYLLNEDWDPILKQMTQNKCKLNTNTLSRPERAVLLYIIQTGKIVQ